MITKTFRYIFVFLLAAACFTLSAQQDNFLTIKGTVTEASTGNALPGVSIVIRGALRGTTTNMNGEFSIKASRGERLVFSFIGFMTHECLVTGETNNLKIALHDRSEIVHVNPVNTTSVPAQDDWQPVTALSPQAAMEEIQKRYWAALSGKNYVQAVKAITYRMKYQKMIQENTTVALLDSLKQDVARLPQPSKSIVYMLMADVYKSYYRTNLGKIRQRTRATVVDDDINTWDISRLFEEALKYFKLSIQEEKILQQTPLDEYNEILFYVSGEDKQKLTLPTLYDLLVFRAVQAYGSELSVTLPQQTFVADRPEYFADARTFAGYSIPVTDTLSAEYQVISLYRKLLHFRLQQPENADNRYALVNIDVERLRYILGHGRYADVNLMYENALKELIDKYRPYSEKVYPMYALATFYNNLAFNRSENSGRRSKYREAYQLCEQIAISGDSVMVQYAKELQDEIKNASLTLNINYLQYPDAPVLARVAYRNVSKLYLYYYQLTDEEAVKYHRQWNLSNFAPENSFLFRTQTIDLPSQPDYQEYSAEIRLDALPQGIYAVLASDIPDLPEEGMKDHSGKVTTGALFQVSALGVAVNSGGKVMDMGWQDEQPPMYISGKAMIQAYLADSKTGEPVKDGTIHYYCGWDNSTMTHLGAYSTDQYGMACFSQQHDERTVIKLVATHKNNRFVFFSGFYNIPVNRPSESQAVFFTDRSIYRPGQTVYYKALCFENQQLLTDTPVTVDFMDVNRKVITSQELTTGEYGTVQGSFVIPQGLLNGRMNLICKISGQNKVAANTGISVEEYKRPAFELVYHPVEGNYRLNDSVRVSGKANALAGYAVDHARVAYRVVRSEQPRNRYWWTPPVPVSTQREIATGTTVTRSDGTFSITFKAEADDVRNSDLIYQYAVTADVTDTNGETRSASKIVKISNNPLLVETNIPQKIVSRDLLDFGLTTTNLNGDFTPADVVVTLTELKSPARILRERLWAAPDTFALSRAEFEKSFPSDIYDSEDNPVNFPVVKQLAAFQLNTADDRKINLSALKQAKAGWYRLDVKARTAGDIEVEDRAYFRLASTPDGKNAPITDMKDWITSVKNNLYEPGENMEFLVAGGYEKSYIQYEILSGNRVVEQKSIVTGTTPQRIVIPVKEEYRGGVVVQFVMMQNQRVYHQLSNISVPYANKQLDVAFTSFRDRLTPGEQEKWTLSVKNQKGEKEMAEMVATLYDASLDAFSGHVWADVNRFYPKSAINYLISWQMPVYPSMRTSSYLYRENKTSRIFQPFFPAYQQKNIEEVVVTGFGARRSAIVEEEVVVTAFGRARRESEVISPVVFEESVVRSASSNISSALGGRVAGMLSYQTDGAPRELNDFWVRGIGASGGNNNALVIIDGIEGDINSLDPADVESFSVLTDASATAVYGVRGANGVILITTRRGKIATRRNFNETAFFYPQLRTGENGEIAIEFTIPEALTRWKMLGFAHTKDFKVGNIAGELVTQKQVAVSANAPRFFREGDVIEFTAKVNNIADSDLSGQATLRLYDAANMQPADAPIIRSPQTQNFSVKAGESAGLKWTLTIPEGIQAITYKVTAQAGNHTDGEEKTVPVLANSLLLTETMPFSVRGGKQKTFTLKPLKENQSNTLRNHRLTLEFTSNPAWYAVQAIPYMMEYPHECAEQVFTRFYANSLAGTLVNSSPRMKQIFELWKDLAIDTSPQEKGETLLSNLEKNQELKQVMLEETPWVMQAANETERKKRLGLLFDLNRMGYEQKNAFEKLQKMQLNDGGFPWFDGLPASRFITQHIVAGMGHLKAMNALDSEFARLADGIVNRAFYFMDDCIREDYNNLLKANSPDLSKQHITPTQAHYLYACSFARHQPQSEAFKFYYAQAVRYWKNFNLYEQAMTALALNRYGDSKTAADIVRSLKERAQKSEETGMYWKDNTAGYFWHQAPIETQAMLIEAFHEVANDLESVEEMKIWLLRHKQTNDWRTTKATAEACYALLTTGGSLLDESRALDIKIGGKPLASVAREEISPEPGTGYVKTSWSGSEIQKDMAVLEAVNPNKSGVAWGGVYWQYFEQLDKIAAAETNLRMNKQLFLKRFTERGAELSPLDEQNMLKVGDIVTVRMELRVDRDYEYVHLKDMRAAGFEPVKTLSGHRFQDGLWYYESIKDASTNFFFSNLRKGTYVFEYELRVTHAGEFSNGVTTFQCMYAPEFSAHSEGARVKIND